VDTRSRFYSKHAKVFKDFNPRIRIVIIGTSQSTVDMVPEELSDEDETFIRFQVGSFRCSSQSGVFITKEATPDGTTYQTKLDMPGAFLLTCMDGLLPVDENKAAPSSLLQYVFFSYHKPDVLG
jgi:hypothetical protein